MDSVRDRADVASLERDATILEGHERGPDAARSPTGARAGRDAYPKRGRENLRVPGPTPLPPTVLAAMARPVIDHRSDAFHALYGSLQEGLGLALRTTKPLIFVAGGGTGAMDASVWLLAPGSEAVVVSNGYFGDRFVDLARRALLRPAVVRAVEGSPLNVEAIATMLRLHPKARAVFLVAHETSAGFQNDAATVATLARTLCPEALVVVDAVSLAPMHPFEADALGIDVLIASSTKALMGPPGYGIVGLSPRAQAQAGARRGHVPATLDLGLALEFHAKDELPFTPAEPVLFGLEAALELYQIEGADAFRARHLLAARVARLAFADMGLSPVSPDAFGSPTVTACWLPEGVDAAQVAAVCVERYGVVLGKGRGAFAHRMLRFAHMGAFAMEEIEAALAALGSIVRGLPPSRVGAALSAPTRGRPPTA